MKKGSTLQRTGKSRAKKSAGQLNGKPSIHALKNRLRSYAAAANKDIFANWSSPVTSADSELKSAHLTLTARSRALERDNALMAAFLRAVEQNVAGPDGLVYQSRIVEPRKVDGKFAMVPDDLANHRLEDAWKDWAKPKNCSASGLTSFAELTRLLIRSVARDGSCLIRKITGAEADNEYNFALQLLEIDHLDTQHFETLANGNTVKFGIEFNRLGKPIAYNLFTVHPGDTSSSYQAARRQKARYPADQIIHVFFPRRISQCIGEPWIVSSMTAIQMLGKLHEYELIASMVAACQGGFFTKTGEGADDLASGEQTAEGTTIQEAIPGAFTQLPPGWDFKDFKPTHPNASITEFSKTIIREICTGSGAAYTTLSGDLSAANYSSARVGLLEERSFWITLQNKLIEIAAIPIVEAWLPFAMISGKVNLPFAKLEKFNKHSFHGRRWPWVDPKNDADALVQMLAVGVTSRTRYCAEQGSDFGEIINDLAMETAIAKEKGVTIVTVDPFHNSVDKQEQPTKTPAE